MRLLQVGLFQASVGAAALILLVITIRALAAYKLPRRAILALWAVILCRLLLPIDLPAPSSIFNFVGRTSAPSAQAVAAPVIHTPQPIHLNADAIPPPPMPPLQGNRPLPGVSPPVLIWALGVAAGALFFGRLYFKWRREFRASLPVSYEWIESWRRDNKLRRPLDVRVCDKISAPLTYGILRPVILLPKSTESPDTSDLAFILAHELAHIRSFDALSKLLATAALCIHWFNPLVWAMYLLFNRDLEIACDERVIRQFGDEAKSPYAHLLIGMAEGKGHPASLGFYKYCIQERIEAIMRTKKASFIGTFMALALLFGATAVFATSGTDSANDSSDTNETYNTDSTDINVQLTFETTDVIVVDGEEVHLAAPVIYEDGSLFVPASFAADFLGVDDNDIVWDESTQRLVILRGDEMVAFEVNSDYYWVRGIIPISLERTGETRGAFIENDRLYIPLRALAIGLNIPFEVDPYAGTLTLGAVFDMPVAPANLSDPGMAVTDIDGRLYVPVRFAAEHMGVPEHNIIWDAERQMVAIVDSDRDRTVTFRVGYSYYWLNGVQLSTTRDGITYTAHITNDRVYVPLHFLGIGLGVDTGLFED